MYTVDVEGELMG